MQDSVSQLRHSLTENGHSLTSPREIVFKALLDKPPQTMQELIAACSPQIDRATVYRTVSLFEKLAITQRLQTGWKYRIELSDTFQPHHHHMYCLTCSLTIELPEDKEMEQRLLQMARKQGFSPLDHQVEIRGLCADCQLLPENAVAVV